ncbi:uncharacterized protein PHACADRAFT_86559, partial [Phanerochaete carnosa HHB-10118-sp]
YTVNITLGGQQFNILLDSGSSDLWIQTNQSVKIVNDSGIVAQISYGEGFVEGPIQFAELKLGAYTVPSQAFLNVNKVTTSQDLPSGTQGILGIAFDSALLDSTELYLKHFWGNDTTLGRTPLSNILNQNTSAVPAFDVSLGRSGDLDEYSAGLFLIGEHAPQNQAVESAPQLPQAVEGRWSAIVEGLSVNGHNYTFKTKSKVTTVPQGQLVGFLDTGTSLPEVPEDVADFIYSNIDGSVKNGGVWFVPCESGANSTWYLGGQAFPMHPLDLTVLSPIIWSPTSDANVNITFCFGAYQIGTPPYQGVDMVLGDNFLRNVYVSFNFGPDIDRTQNGTGSFMQLLSVTQEDTAWVDFERSRMETMMVLGNYIDPAVIQQFPGGLDNLSQQLNGLAPAPTNGTNSTSSSSGASGSSADNEADGESRVLGAVESSSPSSDSDSVVSRLDKYGPVIIGLLGANVGVMLLLWVISLVVCTRGVMRRGVQTRNLPANYAPVSFKDKGSDDPEYSAHVHNYSD